MDGSVGGCYCVFSFLTIYDGDNDSEQINFCYYYVCMKTMKDQKKKEKTKR